MAYRRCISLRAALFARRSSPSFGYFSRQNDRDKPEELRSNIQECPIQRTSFGSNVKSGSWRNCGSVFREGSALAGARHCMNGYMSTSTGNIATALTDVPTEAVASQVPAMSEVAIAAADSAFPVAALQYLIDGVHSFTGLNWWASIALTTVLFRGATIPFLIYESKIYTKIMERMRALFQDPSVHAELNPRFGAIKIKEIGTTPLVTRLIRGFVFIDFYLAITNMAEKVPSFKSGGAFWFTDLTTPDAMFILPILTALTYWCRPNLNRHEVLGESSKGDIGIVPFTAAALAAMNFPQALYCHRVASNVFMRCYQYCECSRLSSLWFCATLFIVYYLSGFTFPTSISRIRAFSSSVSPPTYELPFN